MKKKHIVGALLLLMLCCILPVSAAQAKSKVKLSASKKTIYVGKKTTLTLKNVQKTKWTVTKKNIIHIKKKGRNKIQITGKKKGKTTIKAKYRGKTFRCIVTVKKKADKTKTDSNTVEGNKTARLNQTSVTLYSYYENFLPYIPLESGQSKTYQFKIIGSNYDLLYWEVVDEGNDAENYLKIDNKGLVTVLSGGEYFSEEPEIKIRAVLGDNQKLTATVHIVSTIRNKVQSIFKTIKDTYITDQMTGYKKMEKIAWWLGAQTDYESQQYGWIELLIRQKGDCMASRFAMMYLARDNGLKAVACPDFDCHGQTLVKADGKMYLVVTGFGGERPRGYALLEMTDMAALKEKAEINHIDLGYFGIKE